MINLGNAKKGINNTKPWGFEKSQKTRFLSKFNNKYHHGILFIQKIKKKYSTKIKFCQKKCCLLKRKMESLMKNS